MKRESLSEYIKRVGADKAAQAIASRFSGAMPPPETAPFAGGGGVGVEFNWSDGYSFWIDVHERGTVETFLTVFENS